MKLISSDWYLIPVALVVLAIVAINEVGYGVLALFLLFLAYWLMEKA